MSASERLRELDGAATPGPWYDDTHYPENVFSGCPDDHWDYYLDQPDSDLIVALRNALPLLADVVEAAEDFAHVSVPRHLVEYEDSYVAKMADALSALRDALEEK